MSKFVIILSLLFSSCNAQRLSGRNSAGYVPYTFNWKSNSEFGVVSYKVQRSSNNRNWSTLTNILPKFKPDSNVYLINLPNTRSGYYYRIVAVMHSSNYTANSIYLKTTAR